MLKRLIKNLIKSKFTQIYKKNSFGGIESVSGGGSNLIQTEIIRKEIPKLIKEFKNNSILDAPCGDFYWMKEVDFRSK